MINRALFKLKQKNAETIAEVLVALLVSSLALTLLAGMINSSTKIVDASKKSMNDYYAASTEMETSSSSVSHGSITFVELQSAAGPIKTNGSGNTVYIKIDPANNAVSADYYSNAQDSKVVLYKK